LVRKRDEIFGFAVAGRKVRQILEESPAEKSNLQVGDHIITINHKVVPSREDILTILGSSGLTVTLGVY
jgi:S1-C subfamily serine protease